MTYDSEKVRERTAMLKGEAHGSPSAIDYLLLQCNGLEREIQRLNEGVTIDDKDREISSLHIGVDQLHAQVRQLKESLALKIHRDLDLYGWAIVEENVTPDCYVIQRRADAGGPPGPWLFWGARKTKAEAMRAADDHRDEAYGWTVLPAKIIG